MPDWVDVDQCRFLFNQDALMVYINRLAGDLDPHSFEVVSDLH